MWALLVDGVMYAVADSREEIRGLAPEGYAWEVVPVVRWEAGYEAVAERRAA